MKNKKHLKFVSQQYCLICQNPEVQVHHLLRADGIKGVGRKSSDCWAIPLCVRHHDELHHNGNEIKFFELYGLEYEKVKEYALDLWKRKIVDF